MIRIALASPFLLLSLLQTPTQAQPPSESPAACPSQPTRVLRSTGTATDYAGTVPGIPALCRMHRPDGEGDYYFGVWKTDWPGAGQAYPALYAVITGPQGAQASFTTRSVPGLQWVDTYRNEGPESLEIGGHTYQTLRIAHERTGIEGNTYHSIITSLRDIPSGLVLKTTEDQISGQSYGPDTTWQAVRVEPLP